MAHRLFKYHIGTIRKILINVSLLNCGGRRFRFRRTWFCRGTHFFGRLTTSTRYEHVIWYLNDLGFRISIDFSLLAFDRSASIVVSDVRQRKRGIAKKKINKLILTDFSSNLF